MSISRERSGELIILSESILWALFPVITILTYSDLGPLFTAGITTLISLFFFAGVITARRRWHEMRVTAAWKYILLASLFIGVGFYGLIFWGMSLTSAGNASIIFLTEVLFSFLILGFWKKEPFISTHIWGAFLMVVGAFLVLFQGGVAANKGDLIILVACAIPPIGNYFQQKARVLVSSSFLMFWRSLISGLFLLGFAWIVEPIPSLESITDAWLILLLNGIFILGFSKVLWLEGIHRIRITKAISLASIAPAFTLVFAYFFLSEIPTWWQIAGFAPMAFGIFLLTKKKSDGFDLES